MVLLTRAWYRSAEALMEWIEKSLINHLEEAEKFGIAMSLSLQKKLTTYSLCHMDNRKQNRIAAQGFMLGYLGFVRIGKKIAAKNRNKCY